MDPSSPSKTSRLAAVGAALKRMSARRIAAVAGGIIGALLLVLAVFPWGVLRGRVERAMGERLGTDVTIGAIERRGLFSWTPVLSLSDVRVPQPGWAGEGDLARLDRIDVRLNALALLVGRVDATPVAIEGGTVALIRDADGRRNWIGEESEDEDDDGGAEGLADLAVRDLRLSYRDAVQRRNATVTIAADARGVRAAGRGTVDGRAVGIAFAGAPIAPGRWPFDARLTGSALRMRAHGSMAAPFATGDMAFDMDARADSLKTLDRIVEAGLFGTQPVRLRATVRRTAPRWTIESLTGSIGRSRLGAVRLTVDQGERTRIEGSARFATLDFNDFEDDAGLAAAAALERRLGPRIVPGTRLNLAKLDDLDGTVSVRVDRVLASDPFRSLSGEIVLDRSRLTARDIVATLARGRITGSVVVDQRGGRSSPRMTFDLALAGSTVGTFAGDASVSAPLEGRAELVGTGDTVRQAIGTSRGAVGFYAAAGTLPARMATLLGGDVARGALGNEEGQARLRCLGMRLAVSGGRGRADPLLIDTSRSRTEGGGTVNLADERLALAVRGRSKRRTLLHYDGPVRIGGTIAAPDVQVPDEAAGVGSVLGMLGDAIAGNQADRAGDADCAALRRGALRGG